MSLVDRILNTDYGTDTGYPSVLSIEDAREILAELGTFINDDMVLFRLEQMVNLNGESDDGPMVSFRNSEMRVIQNALNCSMKESS